MLAGSERRQRGGRARTAVGGVSEPLTGAIASYREAEHIGAADGVVQIVWLVIGMVIYYTCGRRHSKVQQAQTTAPASTGGKP